MWRAEDAALSGLKHESGITESHLPDIVNGVLLRSDEVLLALRSPNRRNYASLWSFPGGHVEAGESLDQALHRELTEEVGVIPVKYSMISSIHDPNFSSTIYHMYAVRSWEGEPAILDQEHTELRWFSLSVARAIPDLALEAYRPLFQELSAR